MRVTLTFCWDKMRGLVMLWQTHEKLLIRLTGFHWHAAVSKWKGSDMLQLQHNMAKLASLADSMKRFLFRVALTTWAGYRRVTVTTWKGKWHFAVTTWLYWNVMLTACAMLPWQHEQPGYRTWHEVTLSG